MVVTGPLDTTCIAYTNLLALFEHVQTKITQQINSINGYAIKM